MWFAGVGARGCHPERATCRGALVAVYRSEDGREDGREERSVPAPRGVVSRRFVYDVQRSFDFAPDDTGMLSAICALAKKTVKQAAYKPKSVHRLWLFSVAMHPINDYFFFFGSGLTFAWADLAILAISSSLFTPRHICIWAIPPPNPLPIFISNSGLAKNADQ